MHPRAASFALILFVMFFAIPHFAFAGSNGGIPFFGPIVPQAGQACAGGWGLLMQVINNIISFLLTLAIVFVAPLSLAWAGFLLVINQGDSGKISEARGIITHTVVGIVIALAGWLIVDAVMAVLYNPSLGTWTSLISGSGEVCLPIAASTTGAPGGGAPTTTPPVSVVPGACSIQPLSPITDPLAQQMEGGQTVIWANTDPRLQPCVNKFIGTVGGAVTSAYRPQSYQTHLYEIRDRWCAQNLQSNTDSACADVKNAVSVEVAKHFGANWNCGAVAATNSTHSTGIGVDIQIGSNRSPSDPGVQSVAQQSCLTWKNYSNDPYHYDLISGCSCQ